MSNEALLAWLTSVGLEQHLDVLVAEGVDLDIVPTLSDDDLRSLGFNLGDRRRFLQSSGTANSFVDTSDDRPDVERTIERRNITVLFCDLVGSTALSTVLDDESFARVVREYSAACGKAIEAAGGTVAKYMGDGVMGYFGYPIATGDEAVRAIEGGFLIQKAVSEVDARHEATVAARVGIASGTAIVGEVVGDQVDALGDTPNLAARVESKAEVGSVTVAPLTHTLAMSAFVFEPAGSHEMKGFDEPVPLQRAVRPLHRTASFFSATDAAIVGRSRERAQIERLRHESTERRVLVRIDGEPGIGKSSMLRAAIDDARSEAWRVYVLGCSEHETAHPLHPLRRLIESAAGIDLTFTNEQQLDALDRLADRIGVDAIRRVGRTLLGLDATRSTPAELRAEIFDLAITLVAEATAASPTMLVIEDLQWCDPTSFDLLQEVIATIEDAGVFIVVTERSGVSEFDDRLPADAVIRLDTFDLARCQELVTSIAGHPVSDEIVEVINARAGGVPLYIAELTRSLLDVGAIAEGSDRLTIDIDEIPDTLQDSLQARLDRLPNARDVAPIAAAIGLDFSVGLLQASVAPQVNVDEALRELQRSQLIRTEGDDASFRHALIRNVAYNRLLTENRQIIHGRVGHALAEVFPDRAATEPHVVARHLSLSAEPASSVPWWHDAAQLHARISAHTEVIANVTDGLDILAAEPPSPGRDNEELRLQLIRAGTLRATQGFAADIVGSTYARAVELCETADDLDATSAALNGMYSFHLVRDRYERAGAVARQLLETAEATNDTRRLVIANRAVGVVAFHTADFATSQHHLTRSIELYHSADLRDDAWLIGTDHATTAGSFLAMNELVSGLGDAEQTIGEAERLATEIDHVLSLAQVLTYRGFMAVIAQDWSAAERSGARLLEVLGDRSVPLMTASARFWQAAGRFHGGDTDQVAELWSAARAWWETGAHSYAGFLRSVIAAAESACGEPLTGLATIAPAFPQIEENGERWALAECHRIRAELLDRVGHAEDASRELAQARQVASLQKADLWLTRLGS